MGINTDAIHAGFEDEQFRSLVAPIYQTSTYDQEYPGVTKGYCYTRTGNPTRSSLQSALAKLEEGTDAFSFATGIAAENAIFQVFLKPGDKVVVPYDLYGGTHRLLFILYPQWGIHAVRADYRDPKAVAEAAKGARIVWAESPTNPRLDVYDLPAIVKAVKAVSKALVVVDNTFATPLGQKPLTFGADLVLQSVTKYLSGHSDVVQGAVITKNKELAERLTFIQNGTGGGAAPFDCWLALRGLRTFPIRYKQHCENAQAVAEYLETADGVSKVYYPGLKSHETHATAKKVLKYFGGVVAIELEGGVEFAKNFVSKLKVFKLAESLGGVKSLACHPATMTHAAVSAEERAKIGLSDGLIRLAVGIEDVEDLIADIKQALAAARSAAAPKNAKAGGKSKKQLVGAKA
ncbi:MAG: PLP-dependent aspartate aminotransferase family protein [Planctomycetes bacterium]|nr:PLP-dependent aspartate aminotransferase family protein [Planctomycetota bacterium]NUQ35735.1 PLP-dependent transferase [Planctomycetaceae bacterium]